MPTTNTPEKTRWLDLLMEERQRGDLGGGILRLTRLAAAAHAFESATHAPDAPRLAAKRSGASPVSSPSNATPEAEPAEAPS